MKFYIHLVAAFLVKFKLIIILSIFLGIFMFILINSALPRIKFSNVNRYGYTGRYTVEDLPNEISKLISDGLVEIDNRSEIKPSIAKSWKIEDSGKEWIFEIGDNIVWHDRKPVTAEDLNYNFEDVEISKNGNIIKFTLKEPYIPFAVLLEKPMFKKGLLGTGEWKVKDLVLKGGFVQKIIVEKDNNISVYKFYPTEEQSRFAFKMGEVDNLHLMTGKAPFDKWNNVEIQNVINKNQVVVIFLNTQDPFLSDKNMRLALNYAIDKNLFENRALGPINPESIFYNQQVKNYNFDPDKASDLIKDLDNELPDDYEIKIISTPNLIDNADTIARMWRDIGVNSSVLVSSVIPTDYQAFITIFDIPKDPDQYSLWHSTQNETNITKYKNLRIDKILEDGRVELDKEKRKELYFDFQRFLIEDSPAIFLYHPIWYNIHRK